ncbi:VWA domain-containing protein [Falsibacillus albus]|uniref:VWA domain-containing protein n=2 Tax=Falsibacillus albus TaxID=2478915 RepID=A0A3L7JK84_9BACI|nr:VWA domain-containing protein [Falsibacillus albus]
MLSVTIILLLALGACDSKNDSKNEQHNSQKTSETNKSNPTDDQNSTPSSGDGEVNAQPLPSTYTELASLKMGEHADIDPKLNESEKVVNTFSKLPDIKDNPSHNKLDQFYNELLKMVQQDYKGPEEAIKRLKFEAIGSPEIEDPRYQFKDNLNVEIILDASGSMAQKINGTSKMDTAKSTIMNFVKELPKGAKVGIRVYGNKGSNSDSDKQLSCNSSDVMYPISAFDSNQFQSALGKIKPTGWTPIALALNQAQKDLTNYEGNKNTNIVYLVSDGISTCDDDPIKAAKQLYDSNISPIINVIGFDVDSKGENQLQQIANTTEGIYQTVSDENELQKEFERINDLAKRWEDWKKHNTQKIDLKHMQNNLDIFSYTTEEEMKAVNEGTRIGIILSMLKEDKKMSSESLLYLKDKNREYHQWIRDEIQKFNEQLKSMNDKNYAEAIKELEDKYQKNKQ